MAVSDGHGSVQEGYYIDSAPDFEDRRGVWRRGSAIERFNGGLVGCCSIFLLALRATFLLRWAEQKAAPEWFKLRQGQHRHVDALSRPHLMSRGCDQLPPLTIPRHSKVIPAWMSWPEIAVDIKPCLKQTPHENALGPIQEVDKPIRCNDRSH